MIYLDYSATTFADKKVLNKFNEVCLKYKGNPNSNHKLGVKAKEQIEKSGEKILEILEIRDAKVIYTSGATEANNLAIKGVCGANKGNHIITTKLEHSSVIAPINRLAGDNYEVDFVNLTKDGTVDIEDLKSKIKDNTVLVSIAYVDSELGIKQNIEEIGALLKDYPNCYFHVDATQAIGKIKPNFDNVDLISFSAHKFFGIKGIGALIKSDNVKIKPLLDGGVSTTKFRSGTPATELIISLREALALAYLNFDKKIKYVNDLNKDMVTFLKKYKDININNTKNSIFQNINFSVPNSDKLVELLNANDVYLSTKSACSSADSLSKAIMAVYNDDKRAKESIRISLSYKTTKKEIKEFKKIFDYCYRNKGE